MQMITKVFRSAAKYNRRFARAMAYDADTHRPVDVAAGYTRREAIDRCLRFTGYARAKTFCLGVASCSSAPLPVAKHVVAE